MTTVRKHYEEHLGPVYSWMAGGLDSALARGAAEVDALNLAPRGGGIAVDLGAGFGMHSMALAERGFEVIAIDSCRTLVSELKSIKRELPIRPVIGALESFGEHLTCRPELIVCMGDTLTHLKDESTVQALVEAVSDIMEPGGKFIASFRDYSQVLEGNRRFIPVRADADRILVCFLEYSISHVAVHDILSERQGSEWTTTVSAYRKLRILPDRFQALLGARGFTVERSAGPGGMVRFAALRNAIEAGYRERGPRSRQPGYGLERQ